MDITLMNGTFSDTKATVANGTTDREAYPKRWIAVLVQMCTEKKVGERLSKLGIENYVPTQMEIHQWSDRKKKIERVVMPMVVFVHTDERTEKQIRNYSYIFKVLSYPGHKNAAVIPDQQIEHLKFMLHHADAEVKVTDSVLKVGDEVEVVRGSLKGLKGNICYIEENKPMIGVYMNLLGYVCVMINKNDIK
jgi:transcription antitermination factor NusG